MKLHLFSFFLLAAFAIMQPCTAQSTWQEAATHPSFGIERTFSFEIDGIVYVGGGREASAFNSEEIWAYDITTGNWTPKSNFAGTPRRNAFAFAANGYGYVGAGHDLETALGDFWRYDPVNDTWTQLDDFPGGVRSHALGLSNGDKGYAAVGRTSDSDGYYNDLWEFDAITETWTEIATFEGGDRWRTYGWIIDQTLYIGGGHISSQIGYQDLYAYDLTTGTWETKTPAPTEKTIGGFAFTMQGKGFYIEGTLQTSGFPENYGQRVFIYEPATDTWSEDEAAFMGEGRALGFSQVVDNQAVLGTGRNYVSGAYYNDMYIFTPDFSTAIEEKEALQFAVFPNPNASSVLFVQGDFMNNSKVVYNIYDINGKLQFSKKANANVKSLNIEGLTEGVYQLEIIANDRIGTQRFVKM